MSHTRLGLLLMAGVILAHPFGQALDLAFPTDTVERPAPDVVVWGKPLQGGPLDAVFVVPLFALEDARALHTRLDLAPRLAPVWTSEELGVPEDDPHYVKGMAPDDVASQLRRALKRSADVIVVANIRLSLLSDEVRDRVFAQVRDGAGLVLAHCGEDVPDAWTEFLAEVEASEQRPEALGGVGESLTAEWSEGLAFLDTGTLGEGRVAQLNYLGPRPMLHALLPGLSDPTGSELQSRETYYALIAKVLRWAAGRDPEIHITGLEELAPHRPDAEEIPPFLPEAYVQSIYDSSKPTSTRRCRLQLSAPAPRAYAVRAAVHQPGRPTNWAYTFEHVLRKGDTEYDIYVDAGAGDYRVDVWLLDRSKVATWHSSTMRFTGWPDADVPVLSKTVAYPNDSLAVTFNVPANMSLPRPANAVVRVTDALGRLVAEQKGTAPPSGGPVTVSLSWADMVSTGLYVESFLTDPRMVGDSISEYGLRHADYEMVRIPVHRSLPPDRFTFGAGMDHADEYAGQTHSRTLRTHGVGLIDTPGTLVARYLLPETGQAMAPRLASMRMETAKNDVERVPCLSNPEQLRALALGVQEAAAPYAASGTTLFSLGDGNCLIAGEENVCQTEWCLNSFRQWLTGAYSSVDALQTTWGNTALTFDTAQPLSLEEAREQGRLAPWIDFRRFMDHTFAKAHFLGRESVRHVLPQAQVGFSATADRSPYSGYDWWELASNLDFLVVPPDPYAVDKARSFRPSGAFTALSIGGAASPPDPALASWAPRFAVVNGLQGAWWPRAVGNRSWASPGAGLDPLGRPSVAFTATADAIHAIRSGLDTVLLRAKPAAAQIALYHSSVSRYVNAADGTFAVTETESAIAARLRRLGYAFNVVSSVQAMRGDLNRYSVVVLPMVRAMELRELDALEAYAAQGGRIIADVQPGIFDVHGSARADAPLRHLFDSAGDDSTPMGKHRLLGRPVAPVSNTAYDEEAEILDRMLAEAGILPPARVRSRGKAGFLGTTARFRYGKAHILALLREPSGGPSIQTVRVNWEVPGKRYDMVVGGLPMRGNRFAARLARGDWALYAALPYDVQALELTAPEKIEAGNRLVFNVRVKTKGDLPGEHAVHVTLARVGDHAPDHLSHTVVCSDGAGQHYFPLALNESPGTYILQARDVVTGVETLPHYVEIRARART
jgi:hypothetical protein